MKKIVCMALFCLNIANAYASVDEYLIYEMLSTVNTDYLQSVNNADLVVNGLQAVSKLDSDIIISKGSDKFYLYYKKQIKKKVR